MNYLPASRSWWTIKPVENKWYCNRRRSVRAKVKLEERIAQEKKKSEMLRTV